MNTFGANNVSGSCATVATLDAPKTSTLAAFTAFAAVAAEEAATAQTESQAAAEKAATSAAVTTHAEQKNTFEIENLNLWYGSHHALHDITINILLIR